MAYLDAQALFSDAQAVTAAAASTNLMDLTATDGEIGVGQPIYIEVICDVAMTDGGSNSTLTVTMEQDELAAFGSATEIQTIGTFATDSAIGTRIRAAIAPGVITERFIRLKYTPVTGDLSTGSFTASLQLDLQEDKEYPDGFTIS